MQSTRDFSTQVLVAGGITVGEDARLGQRPAERGLQLTDDARVGLAEPVHEVDRIRPCPPCDRMRQLRLVREALSRRCQDGEAAFDRRPPAIEHTRPRQLGGDERPGARPSVEIPLEHELFVREQHDVARTTELLREIACGRQSSPRWQRS